MSRRRFIHEMLVIHNTCDESAVDLQANLELTQEFWLDIRNTKIKKI